MQASEVCLLREPGECELEVPAALPELVALSLGEVTPEVWQERLCGLAPGLPQLRFHPGTAEL